MRAVRMFVFALGLMFCVSGSAFAQKVTVDYDRSTAFQGFRTYAWVTGTPAKNQLMHQRIVDGIDMRMAAKGLRKVEPDASPDLLITYHGVVDTETQLYTMSTGMGWRGMGSSTTQVEHTLVAALQINIADASGKKLIWQGIATDTVADNPEKNEAKINKALDKLFQKFPPPPAKS